MPGIQLTQDWRMSMNKLKNLLGTAMAQARFDAGHIEWGRHGMIMSYSKRTEEQLTPKQLSEMFETKGIEASDFQRAVRAELIMPPGLLSQVEREVRMLLKDHIDTQTDRVGHAFPIGARRESYYGYTSHEQRIHSWSSPIASFAEAIIKGAAVTGPETVSDQLWHWLEGDDPVTYRTSAMLNGVAFSEPLSPVDGVYVEPLPLSPDDLPTHLPGPPLMRAKDYPGRTVLHIDHEVSPALFRPSAAGPKNTVAVHDVAGVDFDTVCQALSLESNTFVETGFYWYHYLGPKGLVDGGGDTVWSFGKQRFEGWPVHPSGRLVERFSEGVSTLYSDGLTGPKLSVQELANTLDAIAGLDATDSTRTAITRWMKSRDRGEGLEDRFIDLRVALEALYVNHMRRSGYQGELSFRLSLYGAWHLGSNSDDRRGIRKKLNDVYGKGSTAVHTGSVSSDLEAFALLSEGQYLCRRGIRKLLREGHPKDWLTLILGAEVDVGTSAE